MLTSRIQANQPAYGSCSIFCILVRGLLLVQVQVRFLVRDSCNWLETVFQDWLISVTGLVNLCNLLVSGLVTGYWTGYWLISVTAFKEGRAFLTAAALVLGMRNSLNKKSPCSRKETANMGDPNCEFILNMRIPDYILDEDPGQYAAVKHKQRVPTCPVLAFINSKSGGQLGSQLLQPYRVLLSPKQIFDLSEAKPEEVLHRFLSSLEKLKGDGDNIAESILSSFKIIVAGGDGTAGWLLGVVGDLKLTHPPPIATVPLGTGNNLPYSFGWGKKNPGTDLESVKKFLFQVYTAKPMNIDRYAGLVDLVHRKLSVTRALRYLPNAESIQTTGAL
ncbi:hypothetical protein L7F22_006497 [Adiantum nelumboides]|nr:hypothetical protein [Adiantum nelumboides]